MAEQKLFWIGQKSSYGYGKNSLKYGDEVNGKIPDELIPHFKKTGEIGALPVASSKNVDTSAAFDSLSSKLENYKASISEILKFLGNDDNIKKAGESERDALVEVLGGLDE